VSKVATSAVWGMFERSKGRGCDPILGGFFSQNFWQSRFCSQCRICLQTFWGSINRTTGSAVKGIKQTVIHRKGIFLSPMQNFDFLSRIRKIITLSCAALRSNKIFLRTRQLAFLIKPPRDETLFYKKNCFGFLPKDE
jgi:hypothetical protein